MGLHNRRKVNDTGIIVVNKMHERTVTRSYRPQSSRKAYREAPLHPRMFPPPSSSSIISVPLLCPRFESSLVISSFPPPCRPPSHSYISLMPIPMQLGGPPSSTAESCTSSRRRETWGAPLTSTSPSGALRSLMPRGTATSSGT